MKFLPYKEILDFGESRLFTLQNLDMEKNKAFISSNIVDEPLKNIMRGYSQLKAQRISMFNMAKVVCTSGFAHYELAAVDIFLFDMVELKVLFTC